jgi:sulfur relay (sulfurtransferase) DsrC/TusE family protein
MLSKIILTALWAWALCAVSTTKVLADDCPAYLGKLYARGLRQFWVGADRDFGKTVFEPLVDRGFDHKAIAALEDTIIQNFWDHPPSGDAVALSKALRVSTQNAQMVLSFYDVSGTAGLETPTGYAAFTQAKQHMRRRALAPISLYFKANQTHKDITEMTQDLRQQLGKPLLSESQVYDWMWMLNLEMGKAWDREVPASLLNRLKDQLGERVLPAKLSELAIYLYRTQNWSKDRIAETLGISPLSFSHHLHATGIEPNTTAWEPREETLLRQFYGVAPVRELAALLGRTEASVRGHAAKLNLTQKVQGTKPDLYATDDGRITDQETGLTLPIKIGGVLQREALEVYLRGAYQSGKNLTEVAQVLDISLNTLSGWNTKLGLYPRIERNKTASSFDLGAYLASKPKPGHAIFEAFVAGGNKLPSNKSTKGDPGQKLAGALSRRKSTQALLDEIPEELKQQHPEAVQAFRDEYKRRLASPLLDLSKKPGHAIFEAFVAGGNKLPSNKETKGDPGKKLASALGSRKLAETLIEEIPEELKQQHPEAVQAFREEYKRRLASPLLDLSKKPGHAIFEAFVAGGNKLPSNKSTKGDPGQKLNGALSRRKSTQALLDEIPEELKQQHPEAVQAFREEYKRRLGSPLLDLSKKPGHAIFEAFVAGGNKLPSNKQTKGDPGQKLTYALGSRKLAETLIDEIPEELKQQHPKAVQAFREAYERRLTTPMRDHSKTQGHVVFEAFVAGGNELPSIKKIKGDPGGKLGSALEARKPAETLIDEIPEDLKQQHPEAVQAFREAYERRLTTPMRDHSKTQGHVVFEAFVAGGNKLPSIKMTKGDPGRKLGSALEARKPAETLIDEIPDELKQQHPDAVQAFRQAYEARLQNLLE